MIISVSKVFGKSFVSILHNMEELEKAGISRFHIDVADGQAAPFITFGPMVIK